MNSRSSHAVAFGGLGAAIERERALGGRTLTCMSFQDRLMEYATIGADLSLVKAVCHARGWDDERHSVLLGKHQCPTTGAIKRRPGKTKGCSDGRRRSLGCLRSSI